MSESETEEPITFGAPVRPLRKWEQKITLSKGTATMTLTHRETGKKHVTKFTAKYADLIGQFYWVPERNFFVTILQDGTSVQLHRLLADVLQRSVIVRHVNGDHSDNRDENLMIVDPSAAPPRLPWEKLITIDHEGETALLMLKNSRSGEVVVTLFSAYQVPRVEPYDWVWLPPPKKIFVTMMGGRQVSLHRWLIGAPPGSWVHHVNGDHRDNRDENLLVEESVVS